MTEKGKLYKYFNHSVVNAYKISMTKSMQKTSKNK